MSLQITERQVGGVTVLDLSGKLTIDDAALLKDKINSLIVQHRTGIVLNLAQVSYIDSGGLGQLVASYSSVARTGGAVKLLHVSKRNHDLLSITRLVTVFPTFESEPQAIASFSSPAVAAGVDSTAEQRRGSHNPNR
jgi:anti-sigma B factor antagonist